MPDHSFCVLGDQELVWCVWSHPSSFSSTVTGREAAKTLLFPKAWNGRGSGQHVGGGEKKPAFAEQQEYTSSPTTSKNFRKAVMQRLDLPPKDNVTEEVWIWKAWVLAGSPTIINRLAFSGQRHSGGVTDSRFGTCCCCFHHYCYPRVQGEFYRRVVWLFVADGGDGDDSFAAAVGGVVPRRRRKKTPSRINSKEPKAVPSSLTNTTTTLAAAFRGVRRTLWATKLTPQL
jgi:hypothetical protein